MARSTSASGSRSQFGRHNMTKQYRTLRPLVYATDPVAIRRIKRGENVPFADRANKEVDAGVLVDDIPNPELLIRKGWIEPADEPEAEVSDDG